MSIRSAAEAVVAAVDAGYVVVIRVKGAVTEAEGMRRLNDLRASLSEPDEAPDIRQAAKSAVKRIHAIPFSEWADAELLEGILIEEFAAPDELAEAVDIIRLMLPAAEARWEQYDMEECDVAVRARALLKRMEHANEP